MPSKIRSKAIHQAVNADVSTFIRQSCLLSRYVPFSAATLWRLVKTGRFPRPVKVTPQITAWRSSDVQEWAEDPAQYVANERGGK